MTKTCKVCGSEHSVTRCYNLLSCAACKQFFRRTVAERKRYKCRQNGHCDMGTAKGLKCRQCRLAKCLLEGMDSRMVGVEHSGTQMRFFEELDEFARNILQTERRTGTDDENDESGIMRRKEEEDPVLQWDATIKGEDTTTTAAGPLALAPAQHHQQQQIAHHSAILAVPCADKTVQLERELDALAAFERRLSAFHERERDFLPGVLHNFDNTLTDLVATNQGLVHQFEHVTTIVPPADCFRQAALDQNRGHRRNVKPYCVIMDFVGAVDLGRTFPFFGKLDVKDQAKLLGQVALPLVDLRHRFISSEQHSPVVLIPGTGCTPLIHQCADPTVRSLNQILYVNSMDTFNAAKMCAEEFLLLRAIMLAHSASADLSVHGQQLIQREAERYAQMLMHFLQSRHGHFGGAKRYAELLQLAEYAFRMSAKHREMLTYLDVVLLQGHFQRIGTPPAIIALVIGQQ